SGLFCLFYHRRLALPSVRVRRSSTPPRSCGASDESKQEVYESGISGAACPIRLRAEATTAESPAPPLKSQASSDLMRSGDRRARLPEALEKTIPRHPTREWQIRETCRSHEIVDSKTPAPASSSACHSHRVCFQISPRTLRHSRGSWRTYVWRPAHRRCN